MKNFENCKTRPLGAEDMSTINGGDAGFAYDLGRAIRFIVTSAGGPVNHTKAVCDWFMGEQLASK